MRSASFPCLHDVWWVISVPGMQSQQALGDSDGSAERLYR